MPRSTRLTAGLLSVVSVSFGGCQNSAQEAESPYTIRDTEIVLLECDAARASDALDADGNGKAEVYIVREGAREKCRRVDLDLDGHTDRTTHFDAGGQVTRVESDFDRDGRVDEIALFAAGVVTEKHRASTLDGKLDTWEFYQSGRLVRSERDENGDGVIDQWWDYAAPECPLVHVDLDADGRPDPEGTLDYCKATGERVAQPGAKAGSSVPSGAPGAAPSAGPRALSPPPQADRSQAPALEGGNP